MRNKKNESAAISTRDLYLLEVYKCTDVEMLNGHGLKRYTEVPTGIYVLGHRGNSSVYEDYIDIFTNTKYMGEWRDIEAGKQIVHVVSPIVSNKSVITYEEALSILENHNFYCIKNFHKENTKELITLLQKINKLANVDPEQAEEIATEILCRINVDSDAIEEKEQKEEISKEEKGISFFKRRKK